MILDGQETRIERVDDLPLLYGQLEKMGVQKIVDEIIIGHGNWQGLSVGWVIVMWLMYILNQKNHLMEPVEKWVGKHRETLERLSGQAVRGRDFTDDRLALVLQYLHKSKTWQAIESGLGQHLIRVYNLPTGTIRLDATVGSVSHDPESHPLFQVGRAKNGHYERQFKLMLGSLDPLGMPLAVDVVPGNKADDPLYSPSYKRIKAFIGGNGKLIVGDSKMSAFEMRATVVQGEDHYLVPLAHEKAEAGLLDELLEPWSGREAEAERIYLPADQPTDGREPDPQKAIAYGFELSRSHETTLAGQKISWEERLLVVRSKSYRNTMQKGLDTRLHKAEAALRDLTPARQRGKRQIEDEASLLSGIARLEKKYRVQGLFSLSHTKEVREKKVRAYKGKPARLETQVRFQLEVSRDETAIAKAHARAGWRIYVTNAPVSRLSLQQAVLVYRDQYIVENVFARLQGQFLAITPLYIQRDDHAKGLFHLLTIAARLLALGDFQASQALAQGGTELAGIYDGNPKRATATPTTERMLKAFDNIHLLILDLGQGQTQSFLTPLTPVQHRILALLDLPVSLYTDLQLI